MLNVTMLQCYKVTLLHSHYADYHQAIVVYDFVPASLLLVLSVEMVVHYLGFCRAYDGRQRFHVSLPNPTNRFKAI